MNNGPASVIGLPRPQRIFWRLSHNSCVVPLGLHQGGWRRTSPLASHLTPLLPGSSQEALWSQIAGTYCASEGVWAVSNVLPRHVKVTYLPAHTDTRIVQCSRKCSRTLGHTVLFACTARRGMHRRNPVGTAGGAQTVMQVLWYSILPWCQLLKSFFPMSDGTSWNMQIPEASLKHAAWARKGLVFASSHSPRDRRSSMGEKRMGKSSLLSHLFITVSSNLLNTCLFHTQVVRGRQGWFTTVCSDCVNAPDIIQKPKPQCVICFLATLFL